jgi:hypothetical protein
MNRYYSLMGCLVILLIQVHKGFAQIPVEVFGGHKKATIDIMFFKFIKDKEAANSNWLFFNRNRASIDYKMNSSSNLPQFGFTEAISYNRKALKGFAPVAVVQILNRGVYPKLGLQFAKQGNDYTIFTWMVSEVVKDPFADWFFLGRYTPRLTEKMNLFLQAELINAFPFNNTDNFSFIQRCRVGLKFDSFQFGFGADITSAGRNKYVQTYNFGAFLRKEF